MKDPKWSFNMKQVHDPIVAEEHHSHFAFFSFT